MFADGSHTLDKNGQCKALYAVVTSYEILEVYIFPSTKLARV